MSEIPWSNTVAIIAFLAFWGWAIYCFNKPGGRH
jgi:hypothetical protein